MGYSPRLPIETQIACVEREIVMRERVYPKWIKLGRMSVGKAQQELDAMRAVLATLRAVEEGTSST